MTDAASTPDASTPAASTPAADSVSAPGLDGGSVPAAGEHAGRPARSEPSSLPIFRSILRWQAIAAAIVAIVGGALAFALVGERGIWSAIAAAVIGFIFTGVTVLALLVAARMELTWFFAIVLGSWLLKFALFLAAVFLVKDQPWIHPLAFWACLLVAVIASFAIDVVAVLRSRQPYLEVTRDTSSRP